VFEYLEKFNKLPKEVHDRLSSRSVLDAISQLESTYRVDLVAVIIRVVVKDIRIEELPQYLSQELGLDEETARKLKIELVSNIFSAVGDYLDPNSKPAGKDAPDGNRQESLPPAEKEEAPPSAIEKASAEPKFFISADDEEEIKKATMASGNGPDAAAAKADVENKVEEIVKEMKISFSSGLSESRFRQIMRTYLLGIRNRLDTIMTLKKSIETGGLALDEKIVDKILSIADSKKNEPEKASAPSLDAFRQKISGVAAENVRDINYDLKSELERKKAENGKTPEILNGLDLSHELPPAYMVPMPDNSLPEAKKPIPEEKNAEEPNPGKKPVEVPVKIVQPAPEFKKAENVPPPRTVSAPMISRPVDSGRKVRMDDVKFVPKVMSPVDELGQMDMSMFRRLSSDPAAAAAKVWEKIKLMEEEEYAKKIEGIKAWRSSPINRLYLDMGNESILTGKGMADVIAKRRKEGKDFMTIEEMHEVMDLNKKLRF